MTDNIIPFEFEGHAVRSTIIDNQPWFVAIDVCSVLGIANSRDALLKLDSDEKGVALTDTLGGNQELSVVSESGLYVLILRSKKATAPGTPQHRFRKWVTAEVLPAIRKTGGYESAVTDTNRLLMLEEELAEIRAKYLYILEKHTIDGARARDEGRRHARAIKAIVGKLILETDWSDHEITRLVPVDEAYIPMARTAMKTYGETGYYEKYVKSN